MIWIITERQVVKKLRKMSRCITPEEKKNKKLGFSSTYSDYLRRNYGIPEEEFIHKLFNSEFWMHWYNLPFMYLYVKLRSEYLKNFFSDLKNTINVCIGKSYIEKINHNGTIYLRAKNSSEIRSLLSPLYYPKKLIEYEPSRNLIIRIIVIILGLLGLAKAIELFK